MQVILGLDPGSYHLGHSVLTVRNGQTSFVDADVISLPEKLQLEQRLLQLSSRLRTLVEAVRPTYVVVEKAFLGKNVESAMRLGYVRGLCMIECARAGAQLREYATRSIKKSVTGYGAADKEQVRLVLSNIFQISLEGRLDASDALALAFHQSRLIEVEGRLLSQEIR